MHHKVRQLERACVFFPRLALSFLFSRFSFNFARSFSHCLSSAVCVVVRCAGQHAGDERLVQLDAQRGRGQRRKRYGLQQSGIRSAVLAAFREHVERLLQSAARPCAEDIASGVQDSLAFSVETVEACCLTLSDLMRITSRCVSNPSRLRTGSWAGF